MQVLAEALWPILLLGAVGVGIDFLLGHKGQERVKDWLLHKWVAFEDLKLEDFSEKEATYFVALSDRLFGVRFLAWGRFLVCLGLVLASLVYWIERCCSVAPGLSRTVFGTIAQLRPNVMLMSAALEIAIATIFLMFSISLTRWISVQVIHRTAGRRAGILPFFALLAGSLMLLYLWRPFVEAFHDSSLAFSYAVLDFRDWKRPFVESFDAFDFWAYLKTEPFEWPGKGFETVLKEEGTVDSLFYVLFAALRASISVCSYALRAAIATGILFSFAFRRWISRFVSLIWRRVLEDQKGAFTLVLGGLGGIASLLKQVIAHL